MGDSPLGLLWENLSKGTRVIICLAVLCSIAVLLAPYAPWNGYTVWVFSRNHLQLYEPEVEDWNRTHPDTAFQLTLFSNTALRQRLLSGFFAQIPTANLVEVERGSAPGFFAGPADAIGFMDLTEKIQAEGLDEVFLPASFSPWTHQGRIYGLPHDVHPVLLAVRRDLTEEAGIDLDGVETWDQFFETLAPLMSDQDGDGSPDRYLLDLALQDSGTVEALLLQAGGGLFDSEGRPDFNQSVNAEVLATLVIWTDGPDRVTIDAPEFSSSGNRLKIEGKVVAALMPDWRVSVWKMDLPQLSGKWKLIPLPAFQPGGKRTTVFGGTMLGIPKVNSNPEAAWELAKKLYTSASIAEELYREVGEITPISKHWDLPVYSEPSDYFGGQRIGRLFIEYAPEVPLRTSSPVYPFALERLRDAALELRSIARSEGNYDHAFLRQQASHLLQDAENAVRRQLARNRFISPGEALE
jgi:arabinosaccharide transport system substrate-binding protein